MNRNALVGGVVSVFLVTSAWSEALSPDARAITAAVDGFHDALRRGDAQAAMELLAPDAVILESGSVQTRDEYAREHLAEDIAFAKAIPGTRSNLAIKVVGDVAWTSATSQSVGVFNGHEIDSVGAELVILSRLPQGWRIRAIHWSSHRR